MMKKFSTLFLLMVAFMVFAPGCSEKEDVELDAREKFLGQWNVTDSCDRTNYECTIKRDPDNSSQVRISNFAQSDSSVDAYGIVTGDVITVPRQSLDSGWEVDGEGQYKDNVIEWTFSFSFEGLESNCTAQYKP